MKPPVKTKRSTIPLPPRVIAVNRIVRILTPFTPDEVAKILCAVKDLAGQPELPLDNGKVPNAEDHF